MRYVHVRASFEQELHDRETWGIIIGPLKCTVQQGEAVLVEIVRVAVSRVKPGADGSELRIKSPVPCVVRHDHANTAVTRPGHVRGDTLGRVVSVGR